MKRRGPIALPWLVLLLAAMVAAADEPDAQGYLGLKAGNEIRAREEESRFRESVRTVRADRDLAIYRKFLELRKKAHLDPDFKMLSFSGEVTQMLDLDGWPKHVDLLVRGSEYSLVVSVRPGAGIPAGVKVGTRVTVKGRFAGGDARLVRLKQAVLKTDPVPDGRE